MGAIYAPRIITKGRTGASPAEYLKEKEVA
jgi:hypothetical protein